MYYHYYSETVMKHLRDDESNTSPKLRTISQIRF